MEARGARAFVATSLSCLLFVPSLAQITGRIQTAGYPEDFLWGAATAAFQIEGAVAEDGRTPSIWDTFTHMPGNIYDDQNADITDDFYSNYREDIRLMKELGLDSFRFSFSWSRLIVDGNGDVNPGGVNFYNDLIDELLANDIVPFATLYHWDLPQGLQDQYGGWESREEIVEDFSRYARIAFELFGDRVKDWATFNEPAVFIGGYVGHPKPPLRNVTEKFFEISQTIVLAHAHAVDIYRREFQDAQGGQIGIVVNCDWSEPLDATSKIDAAAAERNILQYCGIWADPVYFGDYGADMKEFWSGSLLPFTPAESELVKGSSDFFGLNSYTARYVTDDAECDHSQDHCAVQLERDADGVPIGAYSPGFIVAPWGIRRIINYFNQRYGEPTFYITENGYGDTDVPQSLGLEDVNGVQVSITDAGRVMQLIDTLEALRSTIVEDGVDIRGYFHWSLMDNFEWQSGFSKRFGLLYVDYTKDDRPRTKKVSYDFYQSYIGSAKQHANDVDTALLAQSLVAADASPMPSNVLVASTIVSATAALVATAYAVNLRRSLTKASGRRLIEE